MSKQMYQFTSKSSIANNDVIPFSDENSVSPPHEASQISFLNFLNSIVINQSQVTGLVAALNSINSQISSINSQISTINSQIASLQVDVAQLQIDVTQLQSDVSQLQSDVISLQDQIDTINGDISGLQDQIDAINAQITVINGQIATLQSDVSQLQTDVAQLQTEVDNLQPYTIQEIYVSPEGVDDATSGNATRPYQKVSYAISQITDATFSKRYLIHSVGNTSDNTFTLKPNISFNFHGGSYTLTNPNIIVDPSWNGVQSVVTIENLANNLVSPWVLNLDLSLSGYPPNYFMIILKNLRFSGAPAIDIKGNVNNFSQVYIEDVDAGVGSVKVTNCFGGMRNVNAAGAGWSHTDTPNNNQFTFANCRLSTDDFTVSNTGGSGALVEISGCSMIDPKFIGYGPGQLQIRSRGNDFQGNVLLTSVGSASYLYFNTDTLQAMPIFSGLAEWSGVTIAESIAGTALTVSNQLSEFNQATTPPRANLGVGTGTVVLDVDQDYTLTNPPSKNIYQNMPTSGRQVTLAPAGVAGGLSEGEFILVSSSVSSGSVTYKSGSVVLCQVLSSENWIFDYVGSTIAPLTDGWVCRRNAGNSGTIGSWQETYNVGSTVVMRDNQPINISTGSGSFGTAVGSVPFYAPSFVAVSSVTTYGMSFTATKNGRISAVGYAAAQLPSGTRTIGLWQFLTLTTGTLIGTYTVSSSDPLDSSGHFRRVGITPVNILAGSRYVIGALTPTSDQTLIYFSGVNPTFCLFDGWGKTVNPALSYPVITQAVSPQGQYGNEYFEVEEAIGGTSQLKIQPKAISDLFFEVDSNQQTSAPFGYGTEFDRNQLDPADLVGKGAFWCRSESGGLDGFNEQNNGFNTLVLGAHANATATYATATSQRVLDLAGCTYTLPLTANQWDIVEIDGISGVWRLELANGQSVQITDTISATGPTDYIQSNSVNVMLQLMCTQAGGLNWKATRLTGLCTKYP